MKTSSWVSSRVNVLKRHQSYQAPPPICRQINEKLTQLGSTLDSFELVASKVGHFSLVNCCTALSQWTLRKGDQGGKSILNHPVDLFETQNTITLPNSDPCKRLLQDTSQLLVERSAVLAMKNGLSPREAADLISGMARLKQKGVDLVAGKELLQIVGDPVALLQTGSGEHVTLRDISQVAWGLARLEEMKLLETWGRKAIEKLRGSNPSTCVDPRSLATISWALAIGEKYSGSSENLSVEGETVSRRWIKEAIAVFSAWPAAKRQSMNPAELSCFMFALCNSGNRDMGVDIEKAVLLLCSSVSLTSSRIPDREWNSICGALAHGGHLRSLLHLGVPIARSLSLAIADKKGLRNVAPAETCAIVESEELENMQKMSERLGRPRAKPFNSHRAGGRPTGKFLGWLRSLGKLSEGDLQACISQSRAKSKYIPGLQEEALSAELVVELLSSLRNEIVVSEYGEELFGEALLGAAVFLQASCGSVDLRKALFDNLKAPLSPEGAVNWLGALSACAWIQVDLIEQLLIKIEEGVRSRHSCGGTQPALWLLKGMLSLASLQYSSDHFICFALEFFSQHFSDASLTQQSRVQLLWSIAILRPERVKQFLDLQKCQGLINWSSLELRWLATLFWTQAVVGEVEEDKLLDLVRKLPDMKGGGKEGYKESQLLMLHQALLVSGAFRKLSKNEKLMFLDAAKARGLLLSRGRSVPHKNLISALQCMGVKHESEFALDPLNAQVLVDVYLPDEQIVIEVNGPSHFLSDGRETGSTQLKRDLIHACCNREERKSLAEVKLYMLKARDLATIEEAKRILQERILGDTLRKEKYYFKT